METNRSESNNRGQPSHNDLTDEEMADETFISDNKNETLDNNLSSNNNDRDKMDAKGAKIPTKPARTNESDAEESESTESVSPSDPCISVTASPPTLNLSLASQRLLPLHFFGNMPVFPSPGRPGETLANLRLAQPGAGVAENSTFTQNDMGLIQANQSYVSTSLVDEAISNASNTIRTAISKHRSDSSEAMSESSEIIDLGSSIISTEESSPSFTFASPVTVTQNLNGVGGRNNGLEPSNFPFTSPTTPSCASQFVSQNATTDSAHTGPLGSGRKVNQSGIVQPASVTSPSPSAVPGMMFKNFRTTSQQQERPSVLHIRQFLPVGSNFSNNMNDTRNRSNSVPQDTQSPSPGGPSIIAPPHFRHPTRILPLRQGTTINQDSHHKNTTSRQCTVISQDNHQKTTSFAEVSDDVNLDDSFDIFEDASTRVTTSVTDSAARFTATSSIFVNTSPSSMVRDFGPLSSFMIDLANETVQGSSSRVTSFQTPAMLPPSMLSLKDKSHEALQNKLNKVLTDKEALFTELLTVQGTVNTQQEKIKSQQKDINRLETEKNRLTNQVHKQKQKLDKAVILQDLVFQLTLKCSQLKEENKCLKLEKNQLIKDMDALFDFYSQRCQKYSNKKPNSCKVSTNISDRVNEAELGRRHKLVEVEEDILFLDTDDEDQDDGIEGDVDSDAGELGDLQVESVEFTDAGEGNKS